MREWKTVFDFPNYIPYIRMLVPFSFLRIALLKQILTQYPHVIFAQSKHILLICIIVSMAHTSPEATEVFI